MFTAILTLLAIACAWLLASAVCVGVGGLALVAGGTRRFDRAALLVAFWQGFAVSLAGLEAWHFFAPVSAVSTIAWAAAAAIGWATFARGLALAGRPRWGTAAIVVVAVLWIANRATAVADQFDAGAYHIPAVEWTLATRELPGLANLHYRMAFATLYYPFVASFETLGPTHVATHLANAMLLAITLAMQAGAACELAVYRRVRPSVVALVAALPMTFFYAISKDASSINTDVPVFAVAIAATWMLARLVEAIDSDPDQVPLWRQGTLVGGATLVVLKLSVLPLGVGLAVAAIVVGRRLSPSPRAIRSGATVAVAMLACWTTRSVIVSGHLVFPVVQTRLPLAIAFPAQATRDVVKETSEYPRYFLPQTFVGPLLRNVPGGRALGDRIVASGPDSSLALKTTALLGTFATYGFPNVALPLASAALLALASRLFVRRDVARAFRWLWVPMAASLAYWLIAAPEPRFATAAAWSFAAIVAAAGAARLESASPQVVARWRVVVGAIAMLGVAGVFAFRVAYLRINAYYRDVPLASLLWIPPAPGGGLWPAPVATFKPFATASGLVVQVPDGALAYWGPLLSTPTPSRQLALLHEGDDHGGFVTRSE